MDADDRDPRRRADSIGAVLYGFTSRPFAPENLTALPTQSASRQVGRVGGRRICRPVVGRWRPITNIKLLEGPAKNLIVVMKDGKIHENIIAR